MSMPVQPPKAERVPDSIPPHVLSALVTVYGPNEEHEAFIRAYGKTRGNWEYESLHGPKRWDKEKRAHELVHQARSIAAENGWDWEGILTLAKKLAGLCEDWYTPLGQRLNAAAVVW